ncbi:hypothetical protein ACJX0J_033438, partial [Zea mays]
SGHNESKRNEVPTCLLLRKTGNLLQGISSFANTKAHIKTTKKKIPLVVSLNTRAIVFFAPLSASLVQVFNIQHDFDERNNCLASNASISRHLATLIHQGKHGPIKQKESRFQGMLHILSKNKIYITWG